MNPSLCVSGPAPQSAGPAPARAARAFLLAAALLAGSASCGGAASPANAVNPPGRAAPIIASFSPPSGPVGAQVTIAGANLAGQAAPQVQFNGADATVSAASATSLTVVVPAAATTGTITVSVDGQSATSVTAFTVEQPAPQAPSITTPPASQAVAAGGSATFQVVAAGSPTLTYAWTFGGRAIAGATGASHTIAGATAADAGTYTVTVSNGAGSASASATLTVVPATAPGPTYDLTGFATLSPGTTGGGLVAETDPAYRKCGTPLELATAIRDANKTAGAVRVIEITSDLDLGWNEVGAAVQGLASTPFRAHNAPKLHPALVASGVSVIDVKAKGGGLTLFSASGATLRHAMLNIKSTSNIIVRNLRFDEMWEWDEATKGNYDSNDWDFIDLGNGGTVNNVWIDHCTFTKAYDGAVDIKGGSYNITFSWNRYVGDDGATNPDSFVRRQLRSLEASRASHPMYDFFRSNGFSEEDLVAVSQGHDKTHLIGANALDAANAAFTVTFHHQWYQNTWDRLPRLRAGQVHSYNVFADDGGALAALRLRNDRVAAMSAASQGTANGTYNLKPPVNGSISTEGGAILVEKSVYLDCQWPLRNNQTDPANAAYTGKILATDTIYTMHAADGTATTVRGDSTDPGNPLGPAQAAVIPFSWNTFTALPYAYTPDDPAALPALLAAGAGAGALTWPKENWLKVSY